MSRNGAGVYSLPAGSTAVTGQTILATTHNTPLTDLETDMNTARPVVAGGTGATTAAAARTALGIASPLTATDTTGSANAYLLTTTDTLTPTDGDIVAVVASFSNTGAATIDVDSTGAVAIKKAVSGTPTALAANDIVSGGHYILAYDASASAWIIYNPAKVADVVSTITGLSGSDLDLITGTAGTADQLAKWNADGDLVDGPALTGLDAAVVSGTAGTSGNVAMWNADGDLVDGGEVPGAGGGTAQTAKTATSGTTSDYTGLASGINKITIALNQISTNATDNLLIQLSTSAAFVATGYTSRAGTSGTTVTSTAGIALCSDLTAAQTASGVFTMIRISGTNTWILQGALDIGAGEPQSSATGRIALAGALDGVRLTSIAASTFDATGAGQWSIYTE